MPPATSLRAQPAATLLPRPRLQVWSPEQAADTSAAALQHKHKVTPYAGEPLLGRVLATFVRGQQVFADDGGVAGEACGRSTLFKAPPKRR